VNCQYCDSTLIETRIGVEREFLKYAELKVCPICDCWDRQCLLSR
jgi:hypothetical protein